MGSYGLTGSEKAQCALWTAEGHGHKDITWKFTRSTERQCQLALELEDGKKNTKREEAILTEVKTVARN